MAAVCSKIYFLNRSLFHRNLVVSKCEVQLCKNLGLAQSLQQGINARQRELVSHSLLVEGPVINAHAPPAILFGDKQDRRAVGTRTRPNETLSQESPSPAPPFHPAQLAQVGKVVD